MKTDSKIFFIAGVAFSLISFAGIGFFSLHQLSDQRGRLADEMNAALSSQVAEAMKLWLDEQLVQAATLAADPAVVACAGLPNSKVLRDEVESRFRRTHGLKPYLSLINLMIYRAGTEPPVSVTLNGQGKTIGNGQSLVDSINGRSVGVGGLENFSYIKAVADGNEAFISEVKPNAIPGLPPVFMIAAAVRDENGRLLGALGYGVKIDYFTNLFIADFSMGESGHMEVLDDRGVFIAGRDPRRLFSQTSSEIGRSLLPHLNRAEATAFKMKLAGHDDDFAATPVIPAAPSANRWWVLFHRSDSEPRGELAGYRNWLIFFCSIGAFAGVGLVLAAHRSASARLSAAMSRRKQVYVDSAPYGTLTVYADGRILDANPSGCAIFGCTRAEMLEQNIASLIPAIGEFLAESEEAHYEDVRGRRKDGADLLLVCDLRRLEESETLLFLRDDTELAGHRKSARQLSENLAVSLRESESLRREAEQGNIAKSEFLANMSHEILTPMNAVVGLSHLLGKTNPDERQADYINKIRAAADSLLEIFTDILDYAKIEAGKMNIATVAFAPAAIVAELRDTYGRVAGEKGLAFSLRISPDVPEHVLGDPQNLRRVLGNVLGNAVKFTETGSIELSCDRMGPAPGGGALLRFVIRDTGIGLSVKLQNRLFKAFSQADGSSTRRHGGTGLGLAITRRLLHLMGGEISLESTPGQGTAATILCPFGAARSPGT